MRRAAFLLLVACTKSSSSSPPPPPAPDAAPPRPEGKADLDGDGAVDCWHTDGKALVVQPGCAGTEQRIDLDQMAVVLPKELDTPVWARALAGVIVGDANVGCEAKVKDCKAPHPALRGWLERRTLP